MAIHRITPRLGPEHQQTFSIRRLPGVHWQVLECRRADCAAYLNGWRTTIDESSPLGRGQAEYVRGRSGRRYTEERSGALTVFTFSAGQRCFAEHRATVDREPVYLVKGGDWRGNPRRIAPRTHPRADLWVEEFSENQDRVRSAQERG